MTKARTIAEGAFSYDIANFFIGVPLTNQMVMRFIANRPFVIRAGMPLSVGEAKVGPTAAVVLDIQKNQVSVGSMNFAMSAVEATFTMATETNFVSGDELEIIAPVDPLELSGPSWNLAGIRT